VVVVAAVTVLPVSAEPLVAVVVPVAGGVDEVLPVFVVEPVPVVVVVVVVPDDVPPLVTVPVAGPVVLTPVPGILLDWAAVLAFWVSPPPPPQPLRAEKQRRVDSTLAAVVFSGNFMAYLFRGVNAVAFLELPPLTDELIDYAQEKV
jgi:hypothetical protein